MNNILELHIKNPDNLSDFSEKIYKTLPYLGNIKTPKYLIFIQKDVKTPQEKYQQLLNIVGETIMKLRNELAHEKFQTGYHSLSEAEQDAIDKVYPLNVAFAKPINIYSPKAIGKSKNSTKIELWSIKLPQEQIGEKRSPILDSLANQRIEVNGELMRIEEFEKLIEIQEMGTNVMSPATKMDIGWCTMNKGGEIQHHSDGASGNLPATNPDPETFPGGLFSPVREQAAVLLKFRMLLALSPNIRTDGDILICQLFDNIQCFCGDHSMYPPHFITYFPTNLE